MEPSDLKQSNLITVGFALQKPVDNVLGRDACMDMDEFAGDQQDDERPADEQRPEQNKRLRCRRPPVSSEDDGRKKADGVRRLLATWPTCEPSNKVYEDQQDNHGADSDEGNRRQAQLRTSPADDCRL